MAESSILLSQFVEAVTKLWFCNKIMETHNKKKKKYMSLQISILINFLYNTINITKNCLKLVDKSIIFNLTYYLVYLQGHGTLGK